ncbi:MAG: dipeptide ABC transporter ATP-binding protein [Bacteroidetes bacterium]|nr:dipeptide ABC transporter ATP-binding protein [Bacteroidota bacterium]
MKTEPLIRFKGLSASFSQAGESTSVLHDLNFSLAQGETLGVVGESGSGKSVSSLSILKLIPSPPIHYDTGSIQYEPLDIDLITLDEDRLRQLRGKEISVIFQEPMTSLNPLKRCGEQVMEVFRTHHIHARSEWKEKVIELFESVKLPDPQRAFQAYPHELSGGQKQRVMIAMAISSCPRLLIADEPTTALDVTVQRSIIELLQSLQKKLGMAMIFISHDLAVVSQIADHLVVMQNGRIVEQGETRAVIDRPIHPYTRALLSSRPPSSGRPHRLLTVKDHLSEVLLEAPKLENKEERENHLAFLYGQPPILEVQDLHTWYPIRQGIFQRVVDHVKALNGVSFSLHAGETLGIVGESGCGKSTLGRTLIGLEEKHQGTIGYMGMDVDGQSKEEARAMLREVQMIFQDPYSSLDPRQQIGSAIQEPMEVHGMNGDIRQRKEATLALLEEVGMKPEHYDRYPHEFSGGQRQRICIARALAVSPKILICDESVSALDVSVQAQVLNLLNQIQDERGLSYLFISHDLSVVRYMSDKVMVMNKGLCVEYGEADELYARPKDAYTKTLVSSTYGLEVT